MKKYLGLLLCASLGAGLLATGSGSSVSSVTAAGTIGGRDLFLQPWADNSPWNTSVGNSALFASAGDPETANLHTSDVGINASAWSIPVYLASESDPLVAMSDPYGGTVSMRMPADAAAAAGSDAVIAIVDPSKSFVDEAWMATPSGGGSWSAAVRIRSDLHGDGVSGGIRGAGVSVMGGLIRSWELNAGSIHHALAISLSGSQLRQGWVWPARSEDSNSSWSYTGQVPMGTLVAIPPSVDLNTLGLSADGMILARALQQYGAYVGDQSTGLRFYAEPSAESPRLDNMRGDLDKMVSQLRPIRNNTPDNIGGGGSPLVSSASAPAPAAKAAGAPSSDTVFAFGQAHPYGSTSGLQLKAPIVGMASSPTGNGYWEVAADGGVFAFGDAVFHGSTGGRRLNAPIVGMASSPTGNGYWLAASDGGVFAFGDARFVGSTGAQHVNAPIVGIASSPSGNGYWEAASDGGVFAFGDAKYLGAASGLHLKAPIVGIARTPSGNGYWEAASDGGVFAFGDAVYLGSTVGLRLNAGIVGIASSPSGNGYWLVASDGGVFAFGDAPFPGSNPTSGHRVRGITATGNGAGFWIVI